MKSLVHLFNTAIAELGGEQIPINISPLEKDTTGAICQNIFPHILDTVLESYEWSFAKKKSSLAMVQEQDSNALSYIIRYALPSDCVRPIALLSPTIPYDIEYEREGEHILCNAEQAVLLYVARVNNPTCFPAYFSEVLKWKIASGLATARNNDKQQKQMCEQQYEYALARACAMDRAMQNKRKDVSPWTASRRGKYSRRK